MIIIKIVIADLQILKLRKMSQTLDHHLQRLSSRTNWLQKYVRSSMVAALLTVYLTVYLKVSWRWNALGSKLVLSFLWLWYNKAHGRAAIKPKLKYLKSLRYVLQSAYSVHLSKQLRIQEIQETHTRSEGVWSTYCTSNFAMCGRSKSTNVSFHSEERHLAKVRLFSDDDFILLGTCSQELSRCFKARYVEVLQGRQLHEIKLCKEYGQSQIPMSSLVNKDLNWPRMQLQDKIQWM